MIFEMLFNSCTTAKKTTWIGQKAQIISKEAFERRTKPLLVYLIKLVVQKNIMVEAVSFTCMRFCLRYQH